jgi:hypothetical protein
MALEGQDVEQSSMHLVGASIEEQLSPWHL